MMKRRLGALLGAAIVTSASYHAQSKPAPVRAASAPQRASVRVGDPASNEWPTYGHDPGGMRFSPVTQITPANVSQLNVAWVYHMKPLEAAAVPAETGAGAQAQGRGRGRGGSGLAGSETTPIVADGVMYLSTPYNRVVALDPTTGKEL